MDPLSLTAADVEQLPEDRAREVLAAWVKARRAELPEALAASASKPLARAAKKALYQLRSSGVAVAEPAKAEAPSPAPPAETKEDLPGVLSAILGTGERALYFARPIRGGGLEAYQGVLSDEHGLKMLEVGGLSRGLFRARLRELLHDRQLAVLQVPWGRVAQELGRALALNERSKTNLPDGADAALRRLGVEPLDPDLPVPPPEPADAGLVTRAASLHEEKELRQWLPSEPQLRVLAVRAEEVRSSPLQLSPGQRAAQLAQKVSLTAQEAFTPEVRKLYARRLWLTAELFEATGREGQAQLARAEARLLFHTQAPSRFAERMFEKVLELVPPPAEPKAPAPMSLILP